MSEVQMPEKTISSTASKEKKVEKIIQGSVKTRKKPLGKRIRDVFINEDKETLRGFIIMDVLVPEIKEMIRQTVDVVLFGEASSRGRSPKKESKIQYNSIYSNKKPQTRSERANVKDINDLIFESRGEAEEVLSNLVDFTVDYDVATVADLYDLVGITGSFTDNKYGWTDLSSSSVTRIREGYVLNLPKPIYVE